MAEENTPEPKKSSAMMSVIKAVVAVTILVVVEMVAAAMMIPSAEQTEELAHDLARAAQGEDLADAADEEGLASGLDDPTVEVDLFSNNVTRFNPETDSTLNVDFAVYGVVLEAESTEFTELFEAHSSRIHEQIMLTIHGADTAQLATAGLGLIKRQILEKTNRTLGRPLVREVGFTRLNFIER